MALLEDSVDTLILYDSNRIVIPALMRREVLGWLHRSHPLAETAVNMARDRYFWPHMRQDVLNMVETCQTCAMRLDSQQMEPPQINADRIALLKPMEEVAVDFAVH